MTKKPWYNKSKDIKYWEDSKDENIIYMESDSFESIFGGKTIKNYIPKQIRELGIYNMSQLSDDFFMGITDEILKRAEKYDKGEYQKRGKPIDELEDIIKTVRNRNRGKKNG